jgi:uncharacterized protein (DUF433 family)
MGEIVVFTAGQVARITGVSERQLRYWDATDFYHPHFVVGERGEPFGRLYSFRDVVALRTIAMLRQEHSIPLQELRRVGAWIGERDESAWGRTQFYVTGRRVIFDDPRTGLRQMTRSHGQLLLPISLEPIAHQVREAALHLRERSEDQIGQISRHRSVVGNAPVVAGTRVPTAAIWHLHQAGNSPDEIARQFPRLTPADVQAAIAFETGRRKRED